MAAVCRQASQGSRAHWDLLLSAPDPRLPTCCLPSVLSSRKQLEGSYEAWHPLFPSPADLQVCELWGMKQQVPCPEITSQALDGVAPPGTLRSVRVPAEAPPPPSPVPWLAHTPCAKPWTPHPKQGRRRPKHSLSASLLQCLFLPCKSFLPRTPPLRRLSQSRLSAWSRAE